MCVSSNVESWVGFLCRTGTIIKGCFRNFSPKRAVYHHEIGHNIRFQHTWTWLPDSTLGPMDPYAPNQNAGETSVTQLTDASVPFNTRHPFDIMGGSIREETPFQVGRLWPFDRPRLLCDPGVFF